MIWTIINFGILFIGLILVSKKPLAEMFSTKHTTVKKAIDEAEQLRATVEKMVTEYQEKLSRMDQEIEQVLKEARAEGEKEKASILNRAEKMAQKVLEDAQLAAEKERERRGIEIRKETMRLAGEKAIEVLKTKITEREHKAFVNELITNVRGL